MKFLLFGYDLNILQSVYDNEILDNGIFKTHDDIINEGIIYKDIEYAFGTWQVPKFTEVEVAKYFPSLKAFFYGAGSVQYFAKPFLNNGIRVFSAWGANAIPVAEYTTSLVILANKGFFKYENTFRESGNKEAKRVQNCYPGNFKTKVGVLGAGMIGRMIIERLNSYDLTVLVYDPFMSDKRAKELGVIKSDLNTIFSECQTITNHLAKNEKTNGIINYEHFSKMKDYTTFINTARGTIINEQDLKRAMRENETLLSILDVLDPDEFRSNSDDIFNVPNIIVTPHAAGSQTLEIKRMGEYMQIQYNNLINNKPTKYEVVASDLETMA
jgi:phosphoglycerate dehydrogenase-like enzyme